MNIRKEQLIKAFDALPEKPMFEQYRVYVPVVAGIEEEYSIVPDHSIRFNTYMLYFNWSFKDERWELELK